MIKARGTDPTAYNFTLSASRAERRSWSRHSVRVDQMLWNLAPTAIKFRRAVAALKNLPWRQGRQVGNVLFHAIASPVPAARTLDKSTNKQARKVLRPYTKRIGVEQGDGGGVK